MKYGSIGMVVLLGILLPACTTTSAQAPSPAPQQDLRGVSITPQNFRLPDGAGCTGDISRFRAIMANDIETGHTTQSVFNQIEEEMKRADGLCSAGQSAAASAHVRATKSRFGYP